ncbi:MAG TPA: ribosome recycling factor [Thermoclostridium sp.]|nr:ribosome recycling factor [Thermoclostridium sp.]
MDYKDLTDRMSKSISVFKEDLSIIRAGRANPRLLDKVTVEYYGTPTPINQVANVSIPEARQIVIQPWDPKVLPDIERAIHGANLGLNPNNDGKIIRLLFPPLTEERRVELTKEVKKSGENSKIAIRQIRRDGIDQHKKMQKASEITEDDLKTAENDIQKITDGYISDIDKIVEDKIKEIMEV